MVLIMLLLILSGTGVHFTGGFDVNMYNVKDVF